MPILTPITDEEMGLHPPQVSAKVAAAEAGFIITFYTWGAMLAPRVWERLYLRMDEDAAVAYCANYINKRKFIFGVEIALATAPEDIILICDTRVAQNRKLLPAVERISLEE